jgi:hypothetical protein
MGDAFPRLGPPQLDRQLEMERERALLSPVFEEQLGPPTTPALVVHVDIRFMDPVIRSRYSRSYGSSPSFEATNRICRGLVRRIERCCEEFVTRKDSAALEMFKGDTYERKPQRFEMTFRIMRRGKGEWAERTYRSYQKQPLTVAFTKEVMLAAHRMVGLFLRRHDQQFQWLDCPVAETDLEGSQTMVPSRGGPPSLLSVPGSRFIEATQMFEFVPGYTIELSFRSRNLQRQVPTFERRIRVNSTQPAPLTLFLSEDMLGKALQLINQTLDSKERELDDELRDPRVFNLNPENDTLEIGLRVSNNLGPVYSHVQRSIKGKRALFRDQDAIDCDVFLCDIEKYLLHIRDEADSTLNATNDLDFRIVELKGVGWTLRDPAKFTLGPSASYGRRTIQAALDRIQTGIGDVIRGHNIAIHITAHKRGHLVLDKAIVAHEKHGKPKETFASREDAQAVFVARLKTRIQKDIDRVFEDSCCIDDIPEDEEDYFARPVTPAQPDQPVFEDLPPRYSPSSIRSSPAKPSRTLLSSIQSSPRPRAQRVFSLSRRSTESMRSIDYLRTAHGSLTNDGSRPSTAASEHVSESRAGEPAVLEVGGPLLVPADVKPARSFSLVSRKSSSATRVSNGSSLVEEQAVTVTGNANMDSLDHKQTKDVQQGSREICASGGMTSNTEGLSTAVARSGNHPGEAAQGASLASSPAAQQHEAPSGDDDTIDAPSTVPEAKRGKMETPETFEDAREYVTSSVSEAKANPEALETLTGAVSPREDDEFSTAPSTPELSTGASSPRHSVLVTPVYLRSHAGTKEPVLQPFYPDSGPEPPAVVPDRESTAELVIREGRDCAAALEPQVDQHASSPPSPSVAEPSTAAKAPEDAHHGDANRHFTEKTSDPTARAVSRDETSDDAKPTPTSTSRPPTASDASPSEPSINPKPASDTQIYCPSPLGAEPSPPGSDGTSSHAHAPPPDFPTPQVRTSHAREQPSHSRPVLNPDVNSANKREQEIELETEPSHATESAGSELGAGTGAEGRFGRDSDGGDATDDVGDAWPGESCGAEPGAGSVMLEVAAEGDAVGTERSDEDGRQVTKGNDGPEPGETVCSVGGDNAGDGPGIAAGEDEEGRVAAEDVTAVDVGSAKETDVVRSSDDTNAPVLEASDEHTGENDGPVSGAEAQLEPEDAVRGKDETSIQPPETPEDRSRGNGGSGSGTEAQVEPEVAAYDGEGTSPQSSETIENRPSENDGRGSGADAPHVATEEDRQDEDTDKVDTDHSVSETSSEAQANTSGPDAPLEDTDAAPAAPEPEGDGQNPEPTATDAHHQVEGNTLADRPETQGGVAEREDAGVVFQDVASEAHASIPGAEDLALLEGEHVKKPDFLTEKPTVHDTPPVNQTAESEAQGPAPEDEVEEALPDGDVVQLELDAAPAVTEDAEFCGESQHKTGDGIMGQLDAVTAASDVAGAEDMVADIGQWVPEEHASVPAPHKPVNSAGTETLELDLGQGNQESLTEPTVAVEMGPPAADLGDAIKELIPIPGVIGAEPPRLHVGREAKSGPDILAALAEAAEAEVTYRGARQENLGAVPTASGADEAMTPESEAVVASGMAKEEAHDEPEAPVAGLVGESHATETETTEPEHREEQPAEAAGSIQGPPEAAKEVGKSPVLQVFDQDLAQDLDAQTDGIGGEQAYEPAKGAEPCADAGGLRENDIPSEMFGAEVGTEKTGEKLEMETEKPDVSTEPGGLETQSYDKQTAPVISFDDLTTPASNPLKLPAETAKADLPACVPGPPTTAPAAETPPPKAVPSPPQQRGKQQEKPQVPIPDLSKLSPLFPTPSRNSFSSEAASFTSIPRNSVDTIRPSTDDQQQRHNIPLSELPHTSNSRPQTAGYLGIGLCEPRNLEVGLRGALGAVKARRLSLPLQYLLDREAAEGLTAERQASAPESDAGGEGSRLRKRRGVANADAAGEAGGGEEEQSVLPRMMMLLAGAVAIGKILKRGAE